MNYPSTVHRYIIKTQQYFRRLYGQFFALLMLDPVKFALTDQIALLERCWTLENEDEKNRRLLEVCWQMQYAIGNNN